MRALRIDFAPRTTRRALYQTRVLTWLFGFAGIVLSVSAAMSAQTLMDRLEKQESALLHLKVKLSDRTDVKPVIIKSTISDAQAVAVNRAIAQLNLPWRDVLDAVESATPKTIALLSLEPDARRNVVRCMAEAKNSDEMIAYIEQLKKQPFFINVLLTKHEINEQDPNKPLRFQFEAQWQAEAL